MSAILLDTHVAMWAMAEALSPQAAKLVVQAAAREELMLSPISAWETGMLVHMRRIVLNQPLQDYVRALFALPRVVTATLSPSIAVAAAALPEYRDGDPADRLLVASAAAYGARFMTRDRRIHEYAKATHYLRCIEC